MILITGAAGFIGINTVLSLNQQGIKDLILVDRFELEEKSKLDDFIFEREKIIANIDKLRGLGYNKKFTSLKEGIDICKNYFLDTIK